MDIFISYRRSTGSDKAELIREKLEKVGIECFIDKHNIHNEDFLERIKMDIDAAPNFLMVITPGYFDKREDEEDFVRQEILYAKSKNKNIIGVTFDGQILKDIDWDADEEIKEFRTRNIIEYIFGNTDVEEACVKKIIFYMKNENGRKFTLKKKTYSNSWYDQYGMSKEDRLWIEADFDVCKELDWRMLEKALHEPIFNGRDELSLFVYKAYDIERYKKRYDLDPDKPHDKVISNVYGVTYDFYIDKADKAFGKGHFIPSDFKSEEYIEKIREYMDKNGIEGFDIMDLTLVIKDNAHPERRVRELAELLNPKGGIIYIRELDDDYVDAYPDDKGLIKKMVQFLELDDGAGNRHTGKKIFTFLKKAGAYKVYMADEVITSANKGPRYQKRMCDTYFSYLIPEFRQLTSEEKTHKNYQKFVDAYDWLLENYEDVENLMCSTEFYFRAGYVAGYGVFKFEDEDS